MTTDTAPLTTPAATTGSSISPGQQAFITALEGKVSQFLTTKLDGPFSSLNYPAGFHKVLYYGSDGYVNPNTLVDIDKMLTPGSNPLTLTDDAFSAYYAKLLAAATFQFSKADKEIIESENTEAQEQVRAVIQAYTDAGFTFPTPLPAGSPNEIMYVYNQMQTQYGGEANMPTTLAGLQSAMASYDLAAASSAKLQQTANAAMARLKAAVANVTSPNATNGGLQTGPTTYAPAYTLPDSEALNEALNTSTNAVSLALEVSSFTSDSSQVSVAGSADLDLSIADIFDISASGSSSYNASRYVAAGSTLSMSFNYPGVSTLSVVPLALSPDNKTGWYDADIVEALVKNSGQDATGYALMSATDFPLATTFGTGNIFSHLRTFVLSQQPTVSMTFTGGNTSQVSSDFQANVSAQVDILGIFSIGSSSGSYAVQKVDDSSQQGAVTLTFGPTPDAGVSPEDEIVYVMGGVASYPPAA